MEGIQHQLLGIPQHVPGITHNKHRTDRMRLTPLGRNFHRQRQNPQHHRRSHNIDPASILFRQHRTEMRFRFRHRYTVQPPSIRPGHANHTRLLVQQIL